MRLSYCLLLIAAAETWGAEVSLPVHRVAHTVILEAVYLDGQGPFRMMVDTGNASSLIRPQVAKRLGARAAYAVEQVTSAGVRRVPAAVIDRVTVGPVTDRKIEAMIAEVALDGVDGVLGQSWLSRHDYLLDYRNRRLVLEGAPPEGAMRMDLRFQDGRPAVAAVVDGVARDLVVDSGADVLVLFENKPLVSPGVRLLAIGGSTDAGLGSAWVALGDGRERRMTAARVNAPQSHGGLLPANAFRAVYVSNREGWAGLVR
ncbi:MAG: retropepsin-like aspartic protease [Bryobacteraceae bacterium]